MRRCQLSTVNPNFEVFGSRENCDVSKAPMITCRSSELSFGVPKFERMGVACVECVASSRMAFAKFSARFSGPTE